MGTALLTTAALDRARDFVTSKARPLERARFAQLVDGGPLDDVVTELAAFEVEPGGYGRALESDCRAPEASVLGTLTALDILRSAGAPGDHPAVAAATAWLVDHVERDADDLSVWPFLPTEAQSSVHAPWWDQAEPGQLADTFHGFLANPGLAITAHLWRHESAAPGSVPHSLLAELGEQAMAIIDAGLSDDETNAHDAAAHLVGETAVPSQIRDHVADYLRVVLPIRVMIKPEDFSEYLIHPLWIAPEPTHPLARDLTDPLALALDHTIASQAADGSWEPFWDWMGTSPEVWEHAKVEWSGTLVVRNVAALLAHGRVARSA